MKASSCPNLNRETTSYSNFFTHVQDPEHHDNDTTLYKRPKIDYNDDTEPSETSPFIVHSTFLSFGKTNENRYPIDGSFRDWDHEDQTLTKCPPSPNGSDIIVSVGSNQFSGNGPGSMADATSGHSLSQTGRLLHIAFGNRGTPAHPQNRGNSLENAFPFRLNIFTGRNDQQRRSIVEVWTQIERRYSDMAATMAQINSFDALVTLYSRKVSSLRPEGVLACVDDECEHIACWPMVNFVVEMLYVSFVFGIPESVALCQRHLLDILDKIAPDDILVVLSLANICGKECDGLLTRCIENIVRSDVDIITLDRTLPDHIVKRIVDSRKKLGFHGPESSSFPDKHVKRIHRALDSDDVELVRILLKEGHTTIDDAYALHYAVAYCDAKTTTEILDLAIADVNHRNPRGYTVLHIAAMRKEPNIIVSLLTKGAQPAALTSDGRKALRISKRLTRAADYYKTTEKGTASDRLCIEILEQAERRDPLLGEASASLFKLGDDLRMVSSYLESRVALAIHLFPAEATVAMDVARVHDTSEFALPMVNPTSMAGAKRKTMDLDDVPFKFNDEHLNRIKALFKTVELGKHFFPRCSEVLDRMVDNDISELVFMQNETREEHQLKKQRYMELKEDFARAFQQDKEEFNNLINIPSSSSSTSTRGVGRPNGNVTRKK